MVSMIWSDPFREPPPHRCRGRHRAPGRIASAVRAARGGAARARRFPLAAGPVLWRPLGAAA